MTLIIIITLYHPITPLHLFWQCESFHINVTLTIYIYSNHFHLWFDVPFTCVVVKNKPDFTLPAYERDKIFTFNIISRDSVGKLSQNFFSLCRDKKGRDILAGQLHRTLSFWRCSLAASPHARAPFHELSVCPLFREDKRVRGHVTPETSHFISVKRCLPYALCFLCSMCVPRGLC